MQRFLDTKEKQRALQTKIDLLRQEFEKCDNLSIEFWRSQDHKDAYYTIQKRQILLFNQIQVLENKLYS